MSILLDAVTRSKQQQGHELPDPVMTPRPNYQPQREMPALVSQFKWPLVFSLALVGGVSLAWFASQFNGQAVSEPTSLAATASANIEKTVSASSAKAPENEPPQTVSQTGNVRIAGKVALPLPKAYVAPTADVTPKVKVEQTLEQVAVNSSSSTQVASQSTVQNNLSKATESSMVSNDIQEPIILGANANKRGLDELAKLKREVEYAASDVGLEPQKNSNNLVAAFEAALKEVEANESINKEVTPREVNPIPEVRVSDGVPKFGDLSPALQSQVPDFNINAHVYASAPERRWLNIDGVELQQGDTISQGLRVIEIRPRDVILEIKGQQFKVPAI